MLDQVISNVKVKGHHQLMDVGVSDGIIVYVEQSGAAKEWTANAVVNGEGGVLLPGLVEPHIHLEKAYLLARMEREAGSLQDAIRITAHMKNAFTRIDMRERSLQVVREAVSNGVTHMRCHAEVDPILGLSAIESALELKQSMRHLLDLQVVAFPQEGIFKSPGTAELMEEALRLGCDVVGGITYQDPDLDDHLKFVFDLAGKYSKPLDFHADFSDKPEDLAIIQIAKRTMEYGLQGRVSAGHVTSLGSLAREEAAAAAELLSEAGIHVITLPATDLFINGRGDEEKPRRGLTPVKLLQEKGVNVAIGVNNVQNPFTPFGKADPLETAWLLAITAYMGGDSDASRLLGMLTEGASRVLALEGYGIRVGASADMVLFREKTERDVLLNKSETRTVWKRGVIVADTRIERAILTIL
ncbi:amidohydrolase family protein [Paenibacillus sp. JDR-2]|uniref:amidohydrolase family protein n=1 Tax=Paenibacillus sp. (strain JDR-2) TaxID=324057 RepID=UPI00016667F0|nr:amidohydrolase family protein [Paenibacillus sp. JDR-2]ACT02254.1 Cytosine deaminase [Paenibacillus sp. JDR-2]